MLSSLAWPNCVAIALAIVSRFASAFATATGGPEFSIQNMMIKTSMKIAELFGGPLGTEALRPLSRHSNVVNA